MAKILEKSLKDALKEDKLTLGSRQVLNSVRDSKLVVLSQSVKGALVEKIRKGAEEKDVPLVDFEGTSVALGRLCGLQFRISTISFTSIPDANVKSILKDAEEGGRNA